MSLEATSDYERWAVGLRAWRNDPLTDLSGLPPLQIDSLPPAAFKRLLRHLNEAVDGFMNRWQTQLVAAMEHVRDHGAIAQVLVDARARFAHRLRLADHSGLPEVIRKQLRSQAEIQLRSIQQQLEDSALSMSGGVSGSARADREAILRVYRENALTAVLDPRATSDTVDDPEMRRAEAAEASLNGGVGHLETGTWTAPRRRIVFNHSGD